MTSRLIFAAMAATSLCMAGSAMAKTAMHDSTTVTTQVTATANAIGDQSNGGSGALANSSDIGYFQTAAMTYHPDARLIAIARTRLDETAVLKTTSPIGLNADTALLATPASTPAAIAYVEPELIFAVMDDDVAATDQAPDATSAT